MEEKSSGIFRQRSLERISSPEQLTDYLKVTNPGIWVLLAAVIVLFAGLFVWSMVGDLETVVDGVAVVHDSTAEIMVTGSVNSKMSSGMTVRIGEEEYSISTVEEDDHGRSVAYAPVNEADGKYDVRIVTESIHPIKFLFD
ncbi:hypothetical protein [uncultured Ruminococcus sp.]|uniref:hypothetical protein n=1 Tax=uncultured Ruminococcus sp. TaxID=165186 RepID=UPI000EEAB6A3|nr:hypothetical protein [uncultured Ruminococcus sp.]HCJ40816.1 hypothetical protein [Ruminococcus sp.]